MAYPDFDMPTISRRPAIVTVVTSVCILYPGTGLRSAPRANRPCASWHASADAPARRDLAWVPADACRLPSAEQPLRLAEFEDLFATAVTGLDRLDSTRLRLDLSPRPGHRVPGHRPVGAETDCCGFFTFALTAAEDALSLEVSVPQGRAGVLDGCARASTGRADRGPHRRPRNRRRNAARGPDRRLRRPRDVRGHPRMPAAVPLPRIPAVSRAGMLASRPWT